MVLNLHKGAHNARHLLDKQQGFQDFFDRRENKSIEICCEVFEDAAAMRRWIGEQFALRPRLNGFFVTKSRAW